MGNYEAVSGWAEQSITFADWDYLPSHFPLYLDFP